MRTLALLLLVFFLNPFAFSQQKKVLFLGNSYTNSNNLPALVSELASSTGESLYTDKNTPGGYRFMTHASNATTNSKIKAQEWDFVVLQAQSQEPSWPVAQIESEVFPYAAQLSDSIKANHACTEILFFATWGRENGDSYNCEDWPPVCTFEGMNDRLLVSYYTMAVENEAALAPVGLAWKAVREDGINNYINLYIGDGSHPSIYGSYLTACVMYNSIFKKPVDSDYYSSISENDARYLQAKANEVFTLEYEYYLEDSITSMNYTFNKNAWFENGVSAVADFEYEVNNQEVSFTDRSINAQTYAWNFGDDNTSNLENPVHTYTSQGQYTAKLIVSGNCDSDDVEQTIDLATNIDKLKETEDVFVINQQNALVFSNLDAIEVIELFTLDGKKIAVLDVNSETEYTYKHDFGKSVVIAKYTKDNGDSFSQKIVF